MTDWLDDVERQLRERKKSEATADAHWAHEAAIFQAKSRGVLDAVVAAVRRDVERYSERVKDLPDARVDFTAKPSGGFKLDKPHYPAGAVDVVLDLKLKAIVANYTFTFSASSGASQERELLRLTVDANDNVVFDGKISSVEEASRSLIKPVLTYAPR